MSPGLLQTSQFSLLNGLSVLLEEIPRLDPPHQPQRAPGSEATSPACGSRRVSSSSPTSCGTESSNPLSESRSSASLSPCPLSFVLRQSVSSPAALRGGQNTQVTLNSQHDPAPTITLKVVVFFPEVGCGHCLFLSFCGEILRKQGAAGSSP